MSAPLSAPQAHSPAAGTGVWHSLDAHLRGTAALSEEFATPFGGGALARVLGAAHDTGKAGCTWQAGLVRAATRPGPVGVGHKHAGALLCAQDLHPLPAAALIVLGHHGGLPNWADAGALLRTVHRSALLDAESATDVDPDVNDSIAWVRATVGDLLASPAAAVPAWARNAMREVIQTFQRGTVTDAAPCERLELWLRMCFSAVVDADFLDTEAHFEALPRPHRGRSTTTAALRERWEHARVAMFAGRPVTPTGARRSELYDEVLAGAGHRRGMFRLAAPTGSGKTLTSMGFALHHGAHHDMRRVVVATPFITVTEQNAAVYRDLLDPRGSGDVVEHHSGVDAAAAGVHNRALTANWDAPVVVTTTVQLLESLHSNKPSACRKLHRLANSVIVLDEVQALPHHLLTTILSTLRLLIDHYGCSVVLTTATQPSLFNFRGSPFTDLHVIDLVADPTALYQAFRRVAFTWEHYPAVNGLPHWSQVATDVLGTATPLGGSALLVCSTTGDAASAFGEVRAQAPPGTRCLHLSTRMTREHRQRTLGDVRARLADDLPTLLVSTQVVEAGVDLDFAHLVRVLAPAEALVQAAGRCNREGLSDQGQVRVAVVEGSGTPGPGYSSGAKICQEWFDTSDAASKMQDLDSPTAMTSYFEDFFATRSPLSGAAARALRDSRPRLAYDATSDAFKMIDDVGVPVLVPNPDGRHRALVDALRAGTRLTPGQVRQLVAATASVSRAMATASRAEPLSGDLLLWTGTYDDELGCVADTPAADLTF